MGRLKRLAAGMLERTCSRIFEAPVILGYHRVEDLESDFHQLASSLLNFDAQMETLSRTRRCVFASEVKKGSRDFVVTFDDGYADNLLNALPILERHRIKATFFISTGLLDEKELFWWDWLELALLHTLSRPETIILGDIEYPIASYPRESHTALHRLLYFARTEERQALMRELGHQLRIWPDASSFPRYRVLTGREVHSLAECPYAEIGAHSVAHTRFANLKHEEQILEMRISKERLESLTGKPVRVASFPFGGRSDFTRGAGNAYRQAGFSHVFANFPMRFWPFLSYYEIPRFIVRDFNHEQFTAFLNHLESGSYESAVR